MHIDNLSRPPKGPPNELNFIMKLYHTSLGHLQPHAFIAALRLHDALAENVLITFKRQVNNKLQSQRREEGGTSPGIIAYPAIVSPR